MFRKSRNLLDDLSRKIKDFDAIADENFAVILDLALEVDSQVREDIDATLIDDAYTVLDSMGYNEFLKITIRKLNRCVKTIEDGFDDLISFIILKDHTFTDESIFSNDDTDYDSFVRPFREYVLKIVKNFIDVVKFEILEAVENNTEGDTEVEPEAEVEVEVETEGEDE